MLTSSFLVPLSPTISPTQSPSIVPMPGLFRQSQLISPTLSPSFGQIPQLFPTNLLRQSTQVIAPTPLIATPSVFIPKYPKNFAQQPVFLTERENSTGFELPNQLDTTPATPVDFTVRGSQQGVLNFMQALKRGRDGNVQASTSEDDEDNEDNYTSLEDLDTEFAEMVEQSAPSSAAQGTYIANSQSRFASPMDSWSYYLPSSSRTVLVGPDGRQYSGAGTVVFETSFGSRREPCVILFKSSSTGQYEELADQFRPVDFEGASSLTNIVKRTSLEQTYGLFDFSTVSLVDLSNNQVDRSHSDEIYRCYALALPSGQRNETWNQLYATNKSIMWSKPTPTTWKRTNGMTRFYLSDLAKILNHVARGPINAYDVNNIACVIGARTKTCLAMMLDNYGSGTSIAERILANPSIISLVKNDIAPSSYPFMVGTTSIMTN